MSDHRCRAGKLCKARNKDSAAATSKSNTLCPACIEGVQGCRNDLPAVRAAVQVFIAIKPVSARLSKVASTKQAASPLNLAADTLVSDIDEVLSRVGSYLIRDLISQPPVRFKTWRGDVEQLVYWDGVDLALQISAVHRRAMKLLGFDAQWQRRSAPCWSCTLPLLGQLTGSETVECSGCGARKTVTDYQIYCLEMIKGK